MTEVTPEFLEMVKSTLRNQEKFMRDMNTRFEMIDRIHVSVVKLENSLGFQVASTIDQGTETVSTSVTEPLVEIDVSERKEVPPVDENAVIADLQEYTEELDVSNFPESISPKKFMGDRWQGVMDALKPHGYVWVRDGKNSRWEIGEAKPYEKDLSGFGKSETEIDIEGIDWKVKVDGETSSARPGEKAWAHVQGWDRDAKKSTGEPKRDTKALHDYLQQTDYYCDGKYVFTMNKEATFFNREPMP